MPTAHVLSLSDRCWGGDSRFVTIGLMPERLEIEFVSELVGIEGGKRLYV